MVSKIFILWDRVLMESEKEYIKQHKEKKLEIFTEKDVKKEGYSVSN